MSSDDIPHMFVKVHNHKDKDEVVHELRMINDIGYRNAQRGKGSSFSQYRENRMQIGRGLNKGKSKQTDSDNESDDEERGEGANTYFYKDNKDLVNRFKLLYGEFCAGNDNPKLINQILTLSDMLLDKKLLPKRNHQQIYDECHSF